MRFWLRRRPASLGHRGTVAIHFAFIWVILGMAQAIMPPKADAVALEKNHGQTVLLFANFPVWLQCAMWVVTGLVAVAFSRTDPTRPQDRIAFGALVIPPAITIFSYLWAYLYNVAVNGVSITIYLLGGLLWSILMSLVLFISRWPEPPSGDHAHGHP